MTPEQEKTSTNFSFICPECGDEFVSDSPVPEGTICDECELALADEEDNEGDEE